MNELSLFSGAGGGLLGTMLLGFTPIGYVEWDDYCQRVLVARIKDGILPDAPIFGDIKTFISDGYAASYKGLVDVITGGFPCQDISVSNRNAKGITGSRSGLWKAMYEIIRIVRPLHVFVENSSALVVRGLGTVLSDLAQAGYDCRWCCLRASDIGANHHRDRIWIYANSTGLNGKACQEKDREGFRRIQAQLRGISWWKTEPDLCRVDDGMADRVDKRNHAIGNGQVPAVVATAWRILTQIP
jgi:DNA (cytosine-5)-methyltransferase 1